MASPFKIEENKIIFTGKHMFAFIPQRYENKGFYVAGNSITTLGIFELDITEDDGTNYSKGMILSSFIETIPSDRSTGTRRDVSVFILEYNKGDVFVINRELMRISRLSYECFNEFIFLGNSPKFLQYKDAPFLMDKITDVTGTNLSVDHSVMEMIMASRYIDKATEKPYRLSDMKTPPDFVELKNITNSTESTVAKLYGSYAVEGLTAALTDHSTEITPLEQHVRS